jgi:hypothetical protein
MEQKTPIVEKEEIEPLVLYDESMSLAFDVAQEMKKGYDIVDDVIVKLLKDTRIEDIVDKEGKIIGQRTHIHPQLLAWMREARLTEIDIWKIAGGEVQQEAEKKALETKAKLILAMAKQKPEQFEEALENWKKNRD